jgi:hypothetical protein
MSATRYVVSILLIACVVYSWERQPTRPTFPNTTVTQRLIGDWCTADGATHYRISRESRKLLKVEALAATHSWVASGLMPRRTSVINNVQVTRSGLSFYQYFYKADHASRANAGRHAMSMYYRDQDRLLLREISAYTEQPIELELIKTK